jgi:lipopolysaccharide export system permease protein
MTVFDKYLLKSLMFATVFISLTLACIILLTQSMRFLELIMNSGASSLAFWTLALLALPRFLEIILPIALMAAVVFIYNKLTIDSELIVMRMLGKSPFALARPALYLAGIVTVALFFVTMWVAPTSLSNMHQMRQVIKAQYSTWLFRPGVFNTVVPGLTVFVRARDNEGEMKGIMIHDSRDESKVPVTVVAKKGLVVINENGAQQVLVFDGSRQSVDPKTGALNRLDFSRYSIDLPEGSGPVRQRWKEPDERTFLELLTPNVNNKRDVESRRDFVIEAHRRIISPLLAPAFTVLSLAFLLLGPLDRRGQGWRIVLIIMFVVIIQGLYLAVYNYARNNDLGLVLMYLLTLLPLSIGLFMLSSFSEKIRRRLLYKEKVIQ